MVPTAISTRRGAFEPEFVYVEIRAYVDHVLGVIRTPYKSSHRSGRAGRGWRLRACTAICNEIVVLPRSTQCQPQLVNMAVHTDVHDVFRVIFGPRIPCQ